jgi:hypothetical protein
MLNLIVVEAGGAINKIRQCSARETSVPAEDETQKSGAGVVLVFILHSQDGISSNAAQTLAVVTDAQVRPVTQCLRMNRVSGRRQMRVSASFDNRGGTARMTQTNLAVTVAGAGAAGAAAGFFAKVIVIAITVADSTTVSIAAPTTITARTSTIGHRYVTLHDFSNSSDRRLGFARSRAASAAARHH